MAALSKASQEHGEKQMKRIYQIEKIADQCRLFARNCHHIFKLQTEKARIEKLIEAKKEKIKSRKLITHIYEATARKSQSIKIAQSQSGEAIQWKRKGSSVEWIRNQSLRR